MTNRGDPGELRHKGSWSTPIIFKTSHLFDLFFLELVYYIILIR